jgi:hypothetical protein
MLTLHDRERLKLALTLERHLPAPPLEAVPEPDFDWHRFRQASARLAVVRARKWQAATALAVEDLDRTCDRLIDHLREALRQAVSQSSRPPRASVRDILSDLQALEDEFPAASWDRRAKTLSVTTESITLEGIELGRFQIVLQYDRLGNHRPYWVDALDPHPATGDSTTVHPHVRGDDLCEGDASGALKSALRQGRFFDFFVVVNQVLHTYNKDSPYIPLSRWEGTVCEGCGTTVDDDDLLACELCHSETCSDCSTSCPGCYRTLCGDCRSHCAACGDTHCAGCLKTCSDCSDDYCSHCLREELCHTCQKTREEKEEQSHADQATEEETPEEAGAEVQSAGLGQAAVPA